MAYEMTGFIDDGYNRDDGYVAPPPPEPNGERLHQGLSFTYRMATRRQLVNLENQMLVAKRDEKIDDTCQERSEEILAEFMVKQLKTWDLRDRKKNAVPISVESMFHIHPMLYSAVVGIIRTWRTSDKQPHAKKEPPKDVEFEKNSETESGSSSDSQK